MGLYNAHQFEKQGMKVKIGFMQGAEEWQIERAQEKEARLKAALIEIFTSPVEQVRRRGNGFCVNNRCV